MRMVDLITKKRDGRSLTKNELDFIISGFTAGEIPDYQMSALLMAVFFTGMNGEEIANLTSALVNSGDVADLSGIDDIKVDKHSTGGVGDKISLITIPLVAAAGVPVAKMSGRGLGHTGGTIDKLESIPGFKTELTGEVFINNLNRYKMAIVGQSANLTPADKKLYALRDVTGTVNSIPLIASSVMSKKIASGADAVVLDVKVGSGSFMKSLDDARKLAGTMVRIGKAFNKKTVALITDMSQPLGHEIGNAVEVKEAIDVLRGGGPADLTTVALAIASHMTFLGGAYSGTEQAESELKKIIKSGQALEKLRQLVEIQGGDPGIVDNPEKLPQAVFHSGVKAEEDGYVTGIDTESIGVAAMLLGAGRTTKGDRIDHSAGITIFKKTGDKAVKGDTLCILHGNRADNTDAAGKAAASFSIGPEKPGKIKYIHEVIS